VPNIIDTELFHFIPEQSRNDELTFACVATWKKPKRLDLIIHSLASFAQEEKRQIRLSVIGEGDQKSEFEKNFHHDYLLIEWHGYIPKPKIALVLHKSDFFLHASEIETFSIVTVEALASGLPVVASKTGAIPELIDERNGLLVENTSEAWKYGIRQIVAKNFDRLFIASSVTDKFSPSSVAKKIVEIYDDSFTYSSIN
jgi:glycosyltransferase involved in cell wall biosynthesis